MATQELTVDAVLNLLDYNPQTGEFKWKVTRGKAREGQIAGQPTGEGKALIRIDGVLYQAPRLAWFIHYGAWPLGDLRYLNGLRYDCRIDNLAEPIPPDTVLTAEIARELLTYNQETGEFRWKESRGGAKAGEIAGHLQYFKRGKSYRVIRILDTLHLAHRIGWLMMTGNFPDGELDHEDGDSTNNCFLNLRDSTHSQNMMNKRRPSHNKSGYKGVSWDAINKKWVARIRVPNGKYRNLGRFDDAKLAHDAYCAAANELYGEFARAA